jgi:lipopolysaccharide/colanic/teichoic acid biosynthesis glycosyltransferase
MTVKDIPGAIGGQDARGGPPFARWSASAIAIAVIGALGLLALPSAYGWLVLVSAHGIVIRGALELHIFANCSANMLVMLLAWRLTGRLDRRIAALLNIIIAAHGLLALVIVATHSYYSNRVMIAAVLVSAVLGLAMIGLSRRLNPIRIALIGPRHAVAGQIGFPIDHIEDPAVALTGYDLVLTTFTGVLPPDWAQALTRAMLAGKPVRHAAEYLEEARGLVSIEHFDLEHLPEGGLASYRFGKRALDLLILAAFAPVAIPLLALGSLAVLIFMGRPVFFSQARVGLGGRTFEMTKLRTMRNDQRPEEQIATAHGDARVTFLGGFLRRFHIDELPQLWQVALGEMSFIGPRPEQPALTASYVAQVPAFACRQLVRPGITGWAQVRAGYAANLEETKVKLGYDLFYLKYFSPALDVQIMLRTLVTLVTGGGVR